MKSILGKSPFMRYIVFMPTKKKSPAKKIAVKKTVAKKPAVKSPAQKTTVKSGRPTKAAVKKKSTPVGPREDKLESNALDFVDQAAHLLRESIRTGAKTTKKSRTTAKQNAHELLNKASASLSSLLGKTTSVLRKGINDI